MKRSKPSKAERPPKTAERPTTQQSISSSRGESRQEKVGQLDHQVSKLAYYVYTIIEEKREENEAEVTTQYWGGSASQA